MKRPGTRKPASAGAAATGHARRDRTPKQEVQPPAAADPRESQYRTVIETSKDGFWGCDREGRIVEVNEAYVRLSGYRREELLAMRISDVEAKETPDETAAHIEKILREGSDSFETEHRTKEGKIWPAEVTVTYSPTGGGRFFGFIRDITGRKQAEAALRESGRFMEALIEAAPT